MLSPFASLAVIFFRDIAKFGVFKSRSSDETKRPKNASHTLLSFSEAFFTNWKESQRMLFSQMITWLIRRLFHFIKTNKIVIHYSSSLRSWSRRFVRLCKVYLFKLTHPELVAKTKLISVTCNCTSDLYLWRGWGYCRDYVVLTRARSGLENICEATCNTWSCFF